MCRYFFFVRTSFTDLHNSRSPALQNIGTVFRLYLIRDPVRLTVMLIVVQASWDAMELACAMQVRTGFLLSANEKHSPD